MAKFNVGQRVTALNVIGDPKVGTIQRLYGAHQIRDDDTGIVADVLFDDGPTVMGMPLAKLTRLDKTVTSTPNLGSHSTDAATWQQRISEALSARPGAPLLTLDEACDRIDILWQEASQS